MYITALYSVTGMAATSSVLGDDEEEFFGSLDSRILMRSLSMRKCYVVVTHRIVKLQLKTFSLQKIVTVWSSLTTTHYSTSWHLKSAAVPRFMNRCSHRNMTFHVHIHTDVLFFQFDRLMYTSEVINVLNYNLSKLSGWIFTACTRLLSLCPSFELQKWLKHHYK